MLELMHGTAPKLALERVLELVHKELSEWVHETGL